MMRGKPTEDGSLGGNLDFRVRRGRETRELQTALVQRARATRVVIDINRIRIWSHDHLLFDAEFLDSEFGSNRYRVSAFERGTWLDVVASALMLQLREEGDAIRH